MTVSRSYLKWSAAFTIANPDEPGRVFCGHTHAKRWFAEACAERIARRGYTYGDETFAVLDIFIVEIGSDGLPIGN